MFIMLWYGIDSGDFSYMPKFNLQYLEVVVIVPRAVNIRNNYFSSYTVLVPLFLSNQQ